jgi:hypothetical protein
MHASVAGRSRKAGKFPIYSREDLDAWVRSRLSEPMQSTSALSVYGYDHNPPERLERLLDAPKLVPSTSEPVNRGGSAK